MLVRIFKISAIVALVILASFVSVLTYSKSARYTKPKDAVATKTIDNNINPAENISKEESEAKQKAYLSLQRGYLRLLLGAVKHPAYAIFVDTSTPICAPEHLL
jgi:hypothetical protein